MKSKGFLALLVSLLWVLPVSARPHRIVSLAPSLTEMLFAVGAGSQVVGVSEFCNYPAEARKKPSVGGPNNLNTERILSLAPDLILSPEIGGDLLTRLKRMSGAEVRVIRTGRALSIPQNIRTIGQLTGCAKQANGLAQDLARHLEAYGKSNPKRPRVFYLLWNDPLMTAGGGSYFDDLIRLAGGKNVAGSLKTLYPTYSWETLAYEEPEVIIGPANLSKSLEGLKKRNLKAARTGRIYALDADLLSRPGPRVVQAVEAIRKVLKERRP